MPQKTTYGQRALKRAIGLFRSGQRAEARRELDDAMSWAIQHGDSALWDRAFCNHYAVLQEDGARDVEGLSELRAIVLRSHDDENGFLAAYNAARAYDLRGDQERAKFYLNIAKDRCGRLGRHDWIAWCHNFAGNLYLSSSKIEDACIEYQTALAYLDAGDGLARSQVLDNLGYCRMLQNRTREGMSAVYHGLRTLRRLGLEREQAPLHLSLCYGYLDLDRPERSLAHGLKGLEIARHHEDVESIKNGLYLVGEAHNLMGDEFAAFRCFRELQTTYFPSTPNVPELLIAIDVRSLINLKAAH